MSDCSSLRRIVPIGVLVALVLIGPAAALQAAPFRASGTDRETLIHGNQIEGVTLGVAQPGGPFSGAYVATATGIVARGVETWTFQGGDTLTWAWEVRRLDLSWKLWGGTYVITGGTGRFAGATGSADYLWTARGDGTADFAMEGTINLR